MHLFQFLFQVRSWSRPPAGEIIPVVRKNPNDIIDLSILALLAFTLQRYCGFPTCKAMLQLPSEILQPFG